MESRGVELRIIRQIVFSAVVTDVVKFAGPLVDFNKQEHVSRQEIIEAGRNAERSPHILMIGFSIKCVL